VLILTGPAMACMTAIAGAADAWRGMINRVTKPFGQCQNSRPGFAHFSGASNGRADARLINLRGVTSGSVRTQQVSTWKGQGWFPALSPSQELSYALHELIAQPDPGISRDQV